MTNVYKISTFCILYHLFSLNGVLLGYNNMKVSRTCLPMEDQPFMHLNVQFDAIIFKPVIGSKLKVRFVKESSTVLQ